MNKTDKINSFLILPLLTVLTLLIDQPLNFITGIIWCISFSYLVSVTAT